MIAVSRREASPLPARLVATVGSVREDSGGSFSPAVFVG